MDEKINELVDEKVQEENWVDRFIFEYNYTRKNQQNLGAWIQAIMNGEETNNTGCPIEVFFAQYHAMSSYLACLELRGALMGFSASQDDDADQEPEPEPEPEVTD